MINLDDLYDRQYTDTYTCKEFVAEVWQRLTGKDYLQQLSTQDFEKLSELISPCIVYCHNDQQTSTHVGVFYCGKVLHLQLRGPISVDFDKLIGFTKFEYYR